jgi:hypothetical protein
LSTLCSKRRTQKAEPMIRPAAAVSDGNAAIAIDSC